MTGSLLRAATKNPAWVIRRGLLPVKLETSIF